MVDLVNLPLQNVISDVPPVTDLLPGAKYAMEVKRGLTPTPTPEMSGGMGGRSGLLTSPAPSRIPPVTAGSKEAGGTTIKAYHASPADFEKFDPSKIESGMGHNYYGRGFYFHENPNVADAIRKQYFPKGKVYETSIQADPKKMLQWDKPLSEQPQGLKDALKKLGIEENLGKPPFMSKHLTGKDAMEAMLDMDTVSVRKALGDHTISTPSHGISQILAKNGIPGVSYPASEGGRGYVVFPDTALDITGKR